jgi:GDP-L-fucose synthase
MSTPRDRIFVAGHQGMVGSALVRTLRRHGRTNLLLRTRTELDLTDQVSVHQFFQQERPEMVYLAAARVGGILDNSQHPWDFLCVNLLIATNVLAAALAFDVPRVIFFGSSCIYPKLAPQPLREEYLLTGALEPTNEAYAVAKIAGVKLVEAACTQYGKQWVSLMPTNLYGPGDNFDPSSSHVLPGMLRKFDDAIRSGHETVTVWGSGTPRREFLHVDDLADAAYTMHDTDETGIYNVGYGSDISIRELSALVAAVTGFTGQVVWDANRPDGTPQKLLDSSRMHALGWTPRISLEDGLRQTYAWYTEHRGS